MGEGAAFFDVDRTLIAGASVLRLAKPMQKHGLLSRRMQLRSLIQQVGFSLRGADDDAIDRFTEAAKTITAGWERDTVHKIVDEELHKRIHPTVFREALDRIDMHHRQGQKVYAVSATIEDIIGPLAEMLGLDGAIATEMEVVEGKYTGHVARRNYGTYKAERLREFAAANDIDLDASTAYSDSISDAEFLGAVGRAYAVNPDAKLRKLAEEEGWGILFFRTRVKAPIHHHRAAKAGAVALVAGLAVRSLRRRRKAPK